MTDPLQLLYDEALATGICPYLSAGSYRRAADDAEETLDALEAMLDPQALNLLEQYREARFQTQGMELEAMFRSAFRMARELFTQV